MTGKLHAWQLRHGGVKSGVNKKRMPPEAACCPGNRDDVAPPYLHATPETLWERTRRSKHRPLLQAADPQARLKELYVFRDPIYREVADFVVESDSEQVIKLAQRLEQQLRSAARA